MKRRKEKAVNQEVVDGEVAGGAAETRARATKTLKRLCGHHLEPEPDES